MSSSNNEKYKMINDGKIHFLCKSKVLQACLVNLVLMQPFLETVLNLFPDTLSTIPEIVERILTAHFKTFASFCPVFLFFCDLNVLFVIVTN